LFFTTGFPYFWVLSLVCTLAQDRPPPTNDCLEPPPYLLMANSSAPPSPNLPSAFPSFHTNSAAPRICSPQHPTPSPRPAPKRQPLKAFPPSRVTPRMFPPKDGRALLCFVYPKNPIVCPFFPGSAQVMTGRELSPSLSTDPSFNWPSTFLHVPPFSRRSFFYLSCTNFWRNPFRALGRRSPLLPLSKTLNSPAFCIPFPFQWPSTLFLWFVSP